MGGLKGEEVGFPIYDYLTTMLAKLMINIINVWLGAIFFWWNYIFFFTKTPLNAHQPPFKITPKKSHSLKFNQTHFPHIIKFLMWLGFELIYVFFGGNGGKQHSLLRWYFYCYSTLWKLKKYTNKTIFPLNFPSNFICSVFFFFYLQACLLMRIKKVFNFPRICSWKSIRIKFQHKT